MPCATNVILTSGACETRFWSGGLGDGNGSEAGEAGEASESPNRVFFIVFYISKMSPFGLLCK